MKTSYRVLIVAVAFLALSYSAIANAHEKGDWLLRVGAGMVDPDSDNGNVGGADIDVDSGVSLVFNGTYFFTPNVALEVLAALPFTHDVDLEGAGQVAEVVQGFDPCLAQFHQCRRRQAFDRRQFVDDTQRLAALVEKAVLFFEVGTRPRVVTEDVLRHPRVIERHVVIGPELEDELHDRTRRLVVAGVGDWMAYIEDDPRGRPPVWCRDRQYERSRPVDLPGQRVTGRAVGRALLGGRWRRSLV